MESNSQTTTFKFKKENFSDSIMEVEGTKLGKNEERAYGVEYFSTDMLSPMKNQPRQLFETQPLEELAQSIRIYGILQPIIVSPSSDGKMIIVAGERRWRAAKLAGLTRVPCLIREEKNHSLLELALIENIQRENLSPVEEARSLKLLIDEHEYTQENLAQRIGKSRAAIANSLRLLHLPEKILNDLHLGHISAGHARALCSLENQKLQLKLHAIILQKKLSVRQTEDFIRNIHTEKNRKTMQDSISPDLRYMCDQFKGHLGTKVKISGDSNKGCIQINYYSHEDFERISELILLNSGTIER